MVMLWGFALAAPAADAEGLRIAEQLQSYARSSNWSGVERSYKTLIEEHPRSLDGEIHMLGAQAAKQRGELLLAAQRWMRVLPSESAASAASTELEVLARGARLVALENPARLSLSREELPFDPSMKSAIERANEIAKRDGLYVGLLPMGEYRLGEAPVTVGAGFEWQVLRAP